MFFLPEDASGQGLIEYGLLLALIAVVVLAVLILLGPTVGNMFSQITCNLAWC